MLRYRGVRLLVLMFGALVLSGIGRAAPVDCEDVARLSDFLTGIAVDGCFQGDKLFSNFNYLVNGQVPGSTNPFRPGRVQISFSFGVNTSGQDMHTIEFTPFDTWNVAFTLSYDVSIYQPQRPGWIMGADNQGTYPLPTGNGDLTTVVDPGAWTAHSTPSATDPGPQYFTPVLSVHVSHSYAPGSPTSNLEGFKETLTEQFPIPEPATYILMGSSLLGLGWLGRRLRRR